MGAGGGQPEFTQDAEQALRTAGISTLSEPVPQLRQAQFWVPAAHVPDELQFLRRMLVGMMMRTAGVAPQGLHTPVLTRLPEVDIRPGSIVFSARPAHAIFRRVFHQGLPVCHVLCYTLSHEGYSLLSVLLSVVTQL